MGSCGSRATGLARPAEWASTLKLARGALGPNPTNADAISSKTSTSAECLQRFRKRPSRPIGRESIPLPLKNLPQTSCSLVHQCNRAVHIDYFRHRPLLQEESGAVLLARDLAEFDIEIGREARSFCVKGT